MRVIYDSDDEFDDDELEGETAALKGKDASLKNTNTDIHASPFPCGPGTGSTDSLKKTIEAAHRAHLQSPSVPSLPTAPPQQNPHDLSSPKHRSKRRKTTVDECPGSSSGLGFEKKAPKAYERSKSVFSSPYLDPARIQSTVMDTEDLTEKPWGLEGTMRENYAAHEPMAMFPEPSSTVPNATLTQQRLLDEVMNPAFLGIEPEADAPLFQPAKSSVPWSDFLNTPSGNTETQRSHENAPELPVSQCGGQHSTPSNNHPLSPSLHLDHIRKHTQSSNELVLSQPSQQSLSVQREDGTLQKEILHNGIDPKDIMEAPPIVSLEIWNENGLHTSSRPRSSHSRNKETQSVEENRRSPRRQDPEQNEHISPPPNRKQTSNFVLNSEDDFVAIGIPKEQYKPRPSRSRSLKVDLEHPVDYSIRPERAGKRHSRRSKTTGGTEDAAKQSTPQKVQQICDMGFTPETTQKALKEHNGNVNHTLDWLLINGANGEEDELAPPRLSSSKNKIKKNNKSLGSLRQGVETVKEDAPSSQSENRKVPFSVSVDADSIQNKDYEAKIAETMETVVAEASLSDIPQVPELKSPSRVQVVIPKSKGTSKGTDVEQQQAKASTSEKIDLIDVPSRKPKRRKTTLDQPEPIEEHRANMPTPTPIKEKKRGRGRPRKEVVPSALIEKLQEERKDEPQNALASTQRQSVEARPLVETLTSGGICEQTNDMTPHVTAPPTPLSKTSSTELSQTKEILPRPSTGGPSPLNKAKVQYRVGLSKRARIAPLLRVLKK